MTAAVPVISLPSSRVLSGWCQELADRQPRSLWYSQLLLHRLEALFRVLRSGPLDPLQLPLLRRIVQQTGLSLPTPPTLSGSWLEQLGLDLQVLLRMLRELTDLGLLETQSPGIWQPTEAGRQAVQEETFPYLACQRRVLLFVDNSGSGRPAHFLHLERPVSQPTAPPASWNFDPALLQSSLDRPAEWKQRHCFPADLQGVVLPEAQPRILPSWRQVILDRAEQVLLLLVERQTAGPEGTALEGYAVRREGWILERETPVLRLPADWQEVLPDLAFGLDAEAWRQAWQAWCQPHSLPSGDVAACRLQPQGTQLQVQAPRRLFEKLRGLRGDPVQNEGWLLAGSGRSRQAARIELVEPAG